MRTEWSPVMIVALAGVFAIAVLVLNAPTETLAGQAGSPPLLASCGDSVCDSGEDLISCPADCSGSDLPPTATITYPSTGTVLTGGVVTISVSATDDRGVGGVMFFINGGFRTQDTSAPYSYDWDLNTAGNGPHLIEVYAFDTGGQPSQTVAVNVTVQKPACGNGIIEIGEDCDGASLGGMTCQLAGFAGGTLSCAACMYEYSGCTNTTAKPDLVITSVFVSPPSPTVNQSTSVFFELKNIGTATASPAQFSILNITAPYLSLGGNSSCTASTALAPGQSCFVSNVYSWPTPGNKTILVAADPNNLVDELNEYNLHIISHIAVVGDTTPPSAVPNFRVTGTTQTSVNLAWNAATDNVGIAQYNIYRNGAIIYSGNALTLTDINRIPATTYTYWIEARDTTGNTGPSTTITATTLQNNTNNTTDTTPPAVTIVSPVAGSTVSGIIGISAFAQDANGVQWLRCYVSGFYLGVIYASNGTCTFDTRTVSDGVAVFEVRAADMAGNVGWTKVNATIKNSCTDVNWTPSASGLCGNVTQTSNCGNTRVVPGGITCSGNQTCTNNQCVAVSCNTPASNAFRACFYDNKDFTALKINRVENAINNNWGAGAPAGIAADTFSAKWLGDFALQPGRTYTFSITSDDGMRLYVNGVKLIDDWSNHAARTRTAKYTVPAGQVQTRILVEYYENSGSAVAKVSWS